MRQSTHYTNRQISDNVGNIMEKDISHPAVGRTRGRAEPRYHITPVTWVVARWVNIAMLAALMAKRAAMRPILMEGLA